MLRPRIIPCLLIHKEGLVKTVSFSCPKYVGDPINAVRIFNEKEVDELMVLDIDASVEGREPNYQRISHLANECRMPLCYGGGVKTAEQVEHIVSLGIEKVSLSSAAIDTPEIISEAVRRVGSQSVVVTMDVKKCGLFSKQEVVIHNATRKTGLSPVKFAKEVEALGAGEVVLNSVDRDGTMKGYDIELAEAVRDEINIPMTVMGGAGSKDDIQRLVSQFGVLGAAAGSLFVFKGKYRAVLINYPNREEKERIYQVDIE